MKDKFLYDVELIIRVGDYSLPSTITSLMLNCAKEPEMIMGLDILNKVKMLQKKNLKEGVVSE